MLHKGCQHESKERIAKQKKPKGEGICPICKCVYYTFTLRHSNTCRKISCKNAYQRQRLKEKSVEERKAINKKNYEKYHALKDKETPLLTGGHKQKVLCRCPGCGTKHTRTFHPAWIGNGMPRINCDNYPACIKSDINDPYRSKTMPYVWETDNRATI